MKKHVLITTLVILLLNSCTIEKRIYRPGYYVQWRGHNKEMPIQVKQDKHDKMYSLKTQPIEDELIAQVSNSKEEQLNFSELPSEKLTLVQNNKLTKKSNKLNQPSVPDLNAEKLQTKMFQLQKKNENGDNLIYLTAALMALTTLGLIRTNRKGVIKLTRWAKANPKKTQGLIAGMQLPLITLAFYSGHNLKELGYDLSDTSTYIFGALTALGFLSVPFWSKRNAIAIPKTVSRQRLGYLGITLSSLMMMTSFGNHFVEKYPGSPVTDAIACVDNTIFPSYNTHKVEFSKNEIIQDSIQNNRKAAAGMSLGAAIILIFLLCIVVCAGLCLAGFGVFFLTVGEPLGILGILAGAGIFWLGIKGIQNVSRKRKETKSMKQ